MAEKLNVTIAVVGIDISKNSFHVVGLDERPALLVQRNAVRREVYAMGE
jgi:hypothetical protein